MNLIEETLNLDPIYFIESSRTVKGGDFKIENTGREYLKEIYRYACIGAMGKNYADRNGLICLKGRQVEMTEAALNISLYFLKNYTNFTILHAFPRSEQASRYSRDRLQGAIRTSKDNKLDDILSKAKNASNAISSIDFWHENHCYIYSAWGEGDALRGIAADMVIRDEFQDWTDDSIANTSSCLDASQYKIEFSFGTPKSAGTKFEQLWNDSDQRYYHVKCCGCNHLFVITLENFKTGFMIECPRCKKLQDKRIVMKDGQWIPAKRGLYRVGFHVSQLMSPRITREQISQRQADYSDAKFKNEVLGEFYSGAGVPLEEREVVARCAEPYRNLQFASAIRAPEQTFVGIDWGGRNDQKDKGAYTVITILSKDSKLGKYKLEYTERIMTSDQEKQVSYISDLIRIYNSVSIVADYGYGQFQCQKLQKEYQNVVKSCFYSTNIKNKMKYDSDTWMLSVDRNAFIEDLVDIVKRGNLIIPFNKPDKVGWFIKQICNTELRYSDRTGNVSRAYEKLDRYQPNDALHSLNYAYIASVVHLGETGLGMPAAGVSLNLGMPAPLKSNFSGRPEGRSSPSKNMPSFPNIFRR